MRNVLKILKLYKEKVDLNIRFQYEFPIDKNIFSEIEIKNLSKAKNIYESNVMLKNIIEKKYKNIINTEKVDFWIINEWWWIKSFKMNQYNIDKIRKFKIQLWKNKLSKDSFNTISSLSKIASFLRPKDFVIYDSRVIYTLNRLILKYENRESLTYKYYPIPNGRNKIISDFDIKTIINLKHIKNYINNENVYIPEQEAYFKYCDFIKSTVNQVFWPNAEPYELEMLLFTIADKEIFQDIKKHIKLSIS
mgnify:FL=1